DLVGLGLPGRQDDDRHAGPAPQPPDYVDAGDAGQPEVEDHDDGVVIGGLAEGVLPRVGEGDVVAPGPQVDRQGPEDLRLVVDDQHPLAHQAVTSVGSAGISGPGDVGRTTTMVVTPPGVSSTVSSPPMATVNPRATARPRPTPAPDERSPSRWKGRNTRSRSAGGMPGPRSTIRTWTAPGTPPASTRTGTPGGDQARALSMRLASTRSSRAGSASTRGRVSATPTSTTSPRARSPRLDRAAGTISSTPTGRRWRVSAPAWSRLMSSRLATSPLRRSVSSSMVDKNSATASSDQSTSSWRRLETQALMLASGVRRSCDTAARRAARSSSARARRAASAAPSWRRRRVRAAPSPAVKADRRWRSSAGRRGPTRARTVSSPSGSVSVASAGAAGTGLPAPASTVHGPPGPPPSSGPRRRTATASCSKAT